MREPIIQIKQGDTLRLQCALQAIRGNRPQSMVDWSIESSVRNESGRLIDQLIVADRNAELGTYWLTQAPSSTRSWPPELLSADIRYADATGRVMHTDTFFIRVFKSITLPQ